MLEKPDLFSFTPAEFIDFLNKKYKLRDFHLFRSDSDTKKREYQQILFRL